MAKAPAGPTHVTKGDQLFEDIGFSSAEAAVLRLKARLHAEIIKTVQQQKLKPKDLTVVLNIQQPKVSDLMTGKIQRITADRLTRYLHLLGREVKVTTSPAKKAAAAGR